MKLSKIFSDGSMQYEKWEKPEKSVTVFDMLIGRVIVPRETYGAHQTHKLQRIKADGKNDQ